MTVSIVDADTGEVTEASVFVAALGASNFIYTEVVAGEDLRSWVGAHIRCCEYLGGNTAVWVPDNLKSGVTKPCFYEPDINPTASAARKLEAEVEVALPVMLLELLSRDTQRFREQLGLELLDDGERWHRRLAAHQELMNELGPPPIFPFAATEHESAWCYCDHAGNANPWVFEVDPENESGHQHAITMGAWLSASVLLVELGASSDGAVLSTSDACRVLTHLDQIAPGLYTVSDLPF